MFIRSAAFWKIFAVAVVAAGLFPRFAVASPYARVVPDRVAPGAVQTGTVCGGGGENRCFAHVVIDESGQVAAAAAPSGLGPTDLQSAYKIDPNMGSAPTAPLIAIVDAYGYSNLESDLMTYRQQFGLPPCTIANGCLKVVNQNGATSPLPPNPPANDDWTVETALDVDMASAACPRCRIIVFQSDNTQSINLYTAQNSAAAARVTVISDSWGRPTQVGEDLSQHEPYFNHPGIAQFFSAGDSGYNEGGRGPAYPSTSAYVISVGGTALTRSGTARGWSEVAWTMGGSSCSYSIAKPSFQTASPCTFRASSDISAVGDPATGVAVYNSANGGWLVIGGTSAAAPIVASIFAATGHGNATAAQIAGSTAALFDVTSGSNGPCGNILCNATTGWDGPTGYGTPNAAMLGGTGGGGGGGGGGTLGVTITSPTENSTVKGSFKVTATVTGPATRIGFGIDGDLLETANITGTTFEFTAPTLKRGPHVLQVAVADAQNNVVESDVNVVAQFALGNGGGPADNGDDGKTGGCRIASGASAPISFVIMLVAGLAVRRRRRS